MNATRPAADAAGVIDEEVRDLVARSLAEDIGPGDATSLALIAADVAIKADVIAHEPAVVCGTEVAAEVFRQVDPALVVTVARPDGTEVAAGDRVLRVSGAARAILAAERTALNFMQRLSGITTLTRQFVRHVADAGTAILDTRKTTPSLRRLEKYAVRCGGGQNHRMGLYDRVLIKDNHRALAGVPGGLALDAAIARARERFPSLQIEVEVESTDELDIALRGAPDWVLLDNMAPDRLAACVRRIAGRCRTEASGGITLETVAAVAASGVDAISLGCLTHSAPSIDLSLEVASGGD